jgi:antirestriction protein ArdC
MKRNVTKEAFKKIRDKILELMKTEGSDWTKSWIGSGAPTNFLSKKEYRGMNYFWLAIQPFACNDWGTFKQWQSKGYKIKKGSKGTEVIFASFIDKTKDRWSDSDKAYNARTGKTPQAFLWKVYWVFNGEQVEGYDFKANKVHKKELTKEIRDNIDSFIFNTRAVIKTGESVPEEYRGMCYYHPRMDYIGMPEIKAFNSDVAYYSTLLHELTHWTGSDKRMKRDMSGGMNSESYAKEELVAEIGSAFLSNSLNIEKTVREDHAKYLNTWISDIQNDEKAMITAFSQAQKAVDFLYKLQEKKEGKQAA